ncbi:MAG TPA: SRPBCC domain-containing protein [Tepidisphaeraceae bacterium]|nr:SRPBCC domain-containing protein [Tepidisphaeraceae bacterium]
MPARSDFVRPGAPADREVVVEREFDAPPEMVFEAWTRPEHLGRWWGPGGFAGTFDEVVPPHRLVVSEHADRASGHGEPGGALVHTVTFDETADGGTLLTVRTRFGPATVREAMGRADVRTGWLRRLDRLESELDNVWRAPSLARCY